MIAEKLGSDTLPAPVPIVPASRFSSPPVSMYMSLSPLFIITDDITHTRYSRIDSDTLRGKVAAPLIQMK